jgi:hypothetical protein
MTLAEIALASYPRKKVPSFVKDPVYLIAETDKKRGKRNICHRCDGRHDKKRFPRETIKQARHAANTPRRTAGRPYFSCPIYPV